MSREQKIKDLIECGAEPDKNGNYINKAYHDKTNINKSREIAICMINGKGYKLNQGMGVKSVRITLTDEEKKKYPKSWW